MAKKKATQNQEKHDNTLKPHNKDPNEASMEKLESLKSLNTLLLKEASDRRQQVASLSEVKGSLESELTRSNWEKEFLMSELTQLNEEFLRLDIERNVVYSYVDLQVEQQGQAFEREMDGFWREKVEIEKKMEGLEREMREVLREKNKIEKANREKDGDIEILNGEVNGLVNEIGKERGVSKRAIQERDEMRVNLDLQIEVANGLRSKLIETEGREKGIKAKVNELEVNYKRMMEEKEEKEKRIVEISWEKELIERTLMEANREIEEMKLKVDEIVSENQGIKEESDLEKMKRTELERAVNELNETVLSLQKEEAMLRGNVAELEKKCVEGVDIHKEMGREIYELLEEKKEMKKKQERLVEDKGLVENDLNEALKQLDKGKSKIEELVNETIELAEDKDAKERVILELQKDVEESIVANQKLEYLSKAQMEKIEDLESRIRNYKAELTQVMFERNEARKGFNEEKQNGLALKAKSEEMKDMIEKKLKNSLDQAQKKLNALQGKLELESSNLERFLSMLRLTSEFVCSEDETKVTGEVVTEPYVAELELIKNAFKKKENKVDDMKKQLVILQKSVEAHKKKSFWTLLSSATLLAVLSLVLVGVK